MRTEIKFSESAGRTIEQVRYVEYNGQAVVTFTDGTFAVIGIERGHEVGDEELCDSELCFSAYSQSGMVIELGIVTQAELDAKRKAHTEKQNASIRASELRRFQELKRKFEPEPAD